MKIDSNNQGRKGSSSGLLVVTLLLVVSAILFASVFKAAPNQAPAFGEATAQQANTPSPPQDGVAAATLQYSITPLLQPMVAAATSGSPGHHSQAPAAI